MNDRTELDRSALLKSAGVVLAGLSTSKAGAAQAAEAPPKAIALGSHRELFVDDFLVDKLSRWVQLAVTLFWTLVSRLPAAYYWAAKKGFPTQPPDRGPFSHYVGERWRQPERGLHTPSPPTIVLSRTAWAGRWGAL
ncbi:MAG: hypothetical protein ACO1SX_17820 [Actinomycetota bacterium]